MSLDAVACNLTPSHCGHVYNLCLLFPFYIAGGTGGAGGLSGLDTLILSNCRLGFEGIRDISLALLDNHSLVHLDLSKNIGGSKNGARGTSSRAVTGGAKEAREGKEGQEGQEGKGGDGDGDEEEARLAVLKRELKDRGERAGEARSERVSKGRLSNVSKEGFEAKKGAEKGGGKGPAARGGDEGNGGDGKMEGGNEKEGKEVTSPSSSLMVSIRNMQ